MSAPDVAEVANGLVELCRAGKDNEALARYYSPDIVSVESGDMPDMPAELRGLDQVRKKHEWWYGAFEVNGFELEGPYINANRFTTFYRMDVTHKKTGERQKSSEIALYEVSDGKIVREHFFAAPGERG